MAAAGAGSALLAVGLGLVASCQDFPPVELCGEIPAGGCPLGRGGSCDDTECDALYDCTHGEWVSARRCSRDAGTGGAADDGGPSDGGSDACTPLVIDYTGVTHDCMFDLQTPDCPAAVIDAECAEIACSTDCDLFYVCKSKVWIPVEQCTAAGQLEPYDGP